MAGPYSSLLDVGDVCLNEAGLTFKSTLLGSMDTKGHLQIGEAFHLFAFATFLQAI